MICMICIFSSLGNVAKVGAMKILKAAATFSFFLIILVMVNVAMANSLAASAGTAPQSEGVTCLGLDGDVKFEILVDRTYPRLPVALAMRISDPNVSAEREEIAFFDRADGLLVTDGLQFTGLVSDAHPLTSRRGERVGGTVLGALQKVSVELDIDFTESISPRKRHAATVTYIKKIGEELVQDLDCRRHK